MEHEKNEFQVVCTAHTQTLASRFGRKSKKVALSRGLQLSEEKAAADDWETVTGNRYKSVGVGGAIIGEGFNLLIVDDPYKPLAADTPIPTPSGWTLMGDLKVGDQVFDHAGKICNITRITQRWKAPRHRVWFSDGNFVDTHPNHLWKCFSRSDHAVYTHSSSLYKTDWWKWESKQRGKARVREVTTECISETIMARQTMRNWTIPCTLPLITPEIELPIDPYILGYWLGDGDSRSAVFTVDPEDALHLKQELNRAGCVVQSESNSSDGATLRICASTNLEKGNRWNDSLTKRLSSLNLINNKHIPLLYLRGSKDQRLALLQGLMDSDGNANSRDGEVTFNSINENLARGVCELVVSLGGKMVFSSRKMKEARNGVVYYARGYPTVQPFRLARKALLFNPGGQIRRRNRTITAVEVLEETEHLCITVDAESHLFLAGKGMVPTCNSREEAESETVRESVWEWFTQDLYGRQEPGAAIIIIMSRWHEDDLIGRLLDPDKQDDIDDEWTVVQLPALAYEDDPLGRKVGEALCPDRYNEKALAIRRRIGGEYNFLGQYQQHPTNKAGSFFKIEELETVKAVPVGMRYVRAWDIAASEDSGAFTAGVKMGVWKGIFYVTDVIKGQWDTDKRDKFIRLTAELDGEEVAVLGPQDPAAAGKTAAKFFVRLLAGFTVSTRPVSGDKELRASPFSSQVNAHNVRLLQGPWNKAFVEELRQFPLGKYKDQVDAASDAFAELALTPEASYEAPTDEHVDIESLTQPLTEKTAEGIKGSDGALYLRENKQRQTAMSYYGVD